MLFRKRTAYPNQLNKLESIVIGRYSGHAWWLNSARSFVNILVIIHRVFEGNYTTCIRPYLAENTDGSILTSNIYETTYAT